MKTDKEYPATHSMATAWYCVDEDGNVGVFDIDDNGPVPVGEYRQNGVEDVLWEDFSSDEGEGFNMMNLQSEQILPMLEEDNDTGVWEKESYGWRNSQWMEAIVKIDMAKIDIFKKAISFDKDHFRNPVCLSKDLGLFYVDLFSNKEGVELLENNHVILKKYKSFMFFRSTEYNEENKDMYDINIKKYPFFIYVQDYCLCDDPAIRQNIPHMPMKLWQLPKDVQTKVRKLPLHFSETERIQLAELMPVEHIWSVRYVYDNKIWWELASSDNSLIYYNETTNTIIRKQEMDKYIEEGLAEEWDYDKHHHIENYND